MKTDNLKGNTMRKTFRPIQAANENDIEFNDFDDLQDAVDDASDTIEDLQDTLEDIDDYPQETVLDIDNNIENHYIAECGRCHEVFITAIIESDSDIDSIKGECPCCHKESEQELKWIIRPVNEL